MESIFMNTENNNGIESKKFIYEFTDKLNLKTTYNKDIGQVNLNICYTWKMSNQNTTNINLKYCSHLE